jgi:hypothetical protein
MQLPQPRPTSQALRTLAKVHAPWSITSLIRRSETTRQMHTIIFITSKFFY